MEFYCVWQTTCMVSVDNPASILLRIKNTRGIQKNVAVDQRPLSAWKEDSSWPQVSLLTGGLKNRRYPFFWQLYNTVLRLHSTTPPQNSSLRLCSTSPVYNSAPLLQLPLKSNSISYPWVTQKSIDPRTLVLYQEYCSIPASSTSSLQYKVIVDQVL